MLTTIAITEGLNVSVFMPELSSFHYNILDNVIILYKIECAEVGPLNQSVNGFYTMKIPVYNYYIQYFLMLLLLTL